MSTARDSRQADLAKIHIAKKALEKVGLTEEAYRDLLWAVARVESSADLDFEGRQAVIEHFKSKGWTPRAPHPRSPSPSSGEGAKKKPHRRPRVGAGREPLLWKIEAMLKESDRDWPYAQAMAKRICKRDRIEFCDESDLRKIVAALSIDQRRRQAKNTPLPARGALPLSIENGEGQESDVSQP